jgi:hypothetical protein
MTAIHVNLSDGPSIAIDVDTAHGDRIALQEGVCEQLEKVGRDRRRDERDV